MEKINKGIIEGYWLLLKNISLNLKLDLIERLSKSIKHDIAQKDNRMKASYGAWKSERSAEEIIHDIYNNRSFSREIEEF